MPSVAWYRQWTAWRLGHAGAPALPRHFCRTMIEAPFGVRMLSVPVEGGRRLVTARRYPDLILSEHGNWRHTHWNTITSAYGATPFFHFYEDELRDIYSRRFERLADLCLVLHECLDRAASLTPLTEWLRQRPGITLSGRAWHGCDPSMGMLHLLCHEGPSAIFSLLTDSSPRQK